MHLEKNNQTSWQNQWIATFSPACQDVEPTNGINDGMMGSATLKFCELLRFSEVLACFEVKYWRVVGKNDKKSLNRKN